METIALPDLAPILAAVLGPMLLFMAASMRYQHVDSTRTRDLIEESNRENRRLIEESNRENRRLIEKNRDLIEASNKETRDLIEASNKETRDLMRAGHAELSGGLTKLSGSLADARERLARIEGHLRISPPPRQGASGGDGDAQAA